MNKYEEKLRNMPIKKKMSSAMGSVIASAAIIGIVLLLGMNYISSDVKQLFKGPMTNISDVGDVKYALSDLQREIVRMVAEGENGSAENYSDFEATVEEDIDLLVTAMESMESHFSTEEGITRLEELQEKINEGENIRPNMMSLLEKGEFETAYSLYNSTYRPIVMEVREMADELEAYVYANGTEFYSRATGINRILVIIGILLMVFLVVTSTYISKILIKTLTEPIHQMEEAANLMSTGDMSAWKLIEYRADDELGSVAHSLRLTMKNLNDYVNEISVTLREIAKGDLTKDSDEITDFLGDFASIKESFVYILKNFNTTLTNIQHTSEQVEAGASDISHASAELASGATEQASAVEELTATIETISNLATKSAEQTQEAYNNVLEAASIAEDERKKIDSLITEMKNISDISLKIEEITSTIEDIASQTSLLALNASIEAARAGEAGRGFSVVAEQIGKLAADSSASAVNTRELIVKTMEEIGKGNEITASVAEAFKNTIDEMQKFAKVAKDTNESAIDQANALTQIESGIEQISSVTLATTASTEETSAVSEQLAARALELDGLVKKFQLY